jgi:ribosome assembly protein SQT1
VYAVNFDKTRPTTLVTGGGDDVGYVCTLQSDHNNNNNNNNNSNNNNGVMRMSATTHKLQGHTDSVVAAEFSYDGKYVATASLDATLAIWDPATGARLHQFDGPSDSIECFAWHQRGPVLFAGGGDGTGWLWNAQTKQTLNVFTGHAGPITDALFTPDGKRIVTVSDDLTLRVWDPKTAACLLTVQGYGFHQEGITNVACHPEGHMCASGGTEASAFLSNILTGKIVGELRGHTDAVEATAFVPGFPWCVTASLDGRIGVFDLNTLQARLWITNHSAATPASSATATGITRMLLQQSSAPFVLWTADVQGTVRTWDLRAGGAPIRSWQAHHEPILSLAVSSDSSLFATSSDDCTVRVFSTTPTTTTTAATTNSK